MYQKEGVLHIHALQSLDDCNGCPRGVFPINTLSQHSQILSRVRNEQSEEVLQLSS